MRKLYLSLLLIPLTANAQVVTTNLCTDEFCECITSSYSFLCSLTFADDQSTSQIATVSTTAAPEISSSGAATGIAFTVGAALVIVGRRRRRGVPH